MKFMHSMLRPALFCVSLLFFSFVAPDTKPDPIYPQGYFRSPIAHNINLSATFGELRSNHFHAGLDIKPSKRGVAGDPILAAAEGWIARVKISGSGYGNAIYIGHPNGYTTVYAHLDAVSFPFDTLIKGEQYRQQKFDIDWTLPKGLAPVANGQEIGKMGNTGSSQGVHLHFEIRDSNTDEAINPLLFGFSINDAVAPDIRMLRIYPLDSNGDEQYSYNVAVKKGKTGAYSVAKDTIFVPQTRVGIAIKTYDGTNNNDNQNGVYRIRMLIDGAPTHTFTTERFSFGETRYLNAHIDYRQQQNNDAYFNRSYLLPGNQLSTMYSDLSNRGVIDIPADRGAELTYIVEDYYGNSSTLQAKLIYRPDNKSPQSRNFQYILPVNEASAISNADLRLYLKPNALYETLYMRYFSTNERVSDAFSSVHHIHNNDTPLHAPMELGIIPTRAVPDSLRSKAFIALCSGERTYNYGGSWEDNMLVTYAEQFGDFCIMLDTVAPRITPISFTANMSTAKKMSFRIEDNYAVKGRGTQGLKYNGYIDGRWVLFEYESKGNITFHTFDGTLGSGEHQLRLEATDNRGNMRVYEATFVR